MRKIGAVVVGVVLLAPSAAWAKGPVVSATEEWLRNLSHAFWAGVSLL